jgi:uncharacterized membrane protein YdjX (TVP38/TMEM64 family)
LCYTQAEHLYHVHGTRGEDPAEPKASAPYKYPALTHEPRIQELHNDWQRCGYKPFHLPVGVMLNEEQKEKSACIHCSTYDGFPCLVNAKADSQVVCVDPALQYPNVSMVNGALVTRLEARGEGREVTGVVVERNGHQEIYNGCIVVVSGGAINSAALLLLIGSIICTVMIPPIPNLPLVLAAGAAFGPFDGALYSVIGAEIGAIACFLVARALRRETLSRVMKTEATFGQMCTDHQLMGMVFFARLIPIFSFEVSFGAGLTNISLKTFALATLLGIAPPTFAFTYLGSSMASAQWLLIATGAAMGLFFLAMPKILTKYRDSHLTRLFFGPLPSPAAVSPVKVGIPLQGPLHWLWVAVARS